MTIVGLTVSCISARANSWTNTAQLPDERARLLVAEMTLDEKIAMVHGVSGLPYVGNVTNNSRLGIPALRFQDGPAGIAQGMQGVTAFPAPALLAATWDSDRARQYGSFLGQEARGKGVHVLLGPMINMVRVPQGGRNFELLGEDPYLAANLTAELVRGIQSHGVIANAKTFICNDQETNRGNMNVHVAERTLQEIYFPPFRAAVRAGVGSVMSAYNAVNGAWSSESPSLGAMLKVAWGFDGFVVCDWGANFGTVNGANNVLDLEMPLDVKFGEPLKTAVESGAVSTSQLDDMVCRILTAMFRFDIFDAPATGHASSNVTGVAQAQFCRETVEQGMVLLKNDDALLPLQTNSIHSIAVIGSAAFANPIWVGFGSAQVYLPYYDIPLNAISNRAGTNVTITYCGGDNGSILEAMFAAYEADLAIVCVGEQTSENVDRASLSLSIAQNLLVSSVASVNSNTVVVMYVGAGTLMPWSERVKAILVAWYPGQENGVPLASILFGDVNPSGKLPMTFPAAENEVPANTPSQYPGTNLQVHYSEGLLMGYRWYDASNVAPLFPFGHGLSYTTFGYSNLVVEPVSSAGQLTVTVDVQNTGSRSGSEVVQLYLGFPASAGEPPRQLKGFRKVLLAPGETNRVVFDLGWEDLACWNSTTHRWTVPQGSFQVFVGASSRDLRLTNSFVVPIPIPTSGVANRALFRRASVSSMLTTNFWGDGAVDGDPATGWKSVAGGLQWITIDLGEVREVARTRLQWQTNFARAYEIRFSNDNTNWMTGYSNTNGTGRTEEIVLAGSGRYVQLVATQGVDPTGYSLQEFEVFSPEVTLEPNLSVAISSTTNLNFSWPEREGSILQRNTFLNWNEFWLQQSSDLRTWITVLTNEVLLSGTNSLTLPRPAMPQFYRLKSPSL